MNVARWPFSLRSDTRGAALVEFAVIAPVLIVMLVGVLQVGAWVQGYNAVRNVVNDTARFAMVEYQRGDRITNDAISDKVYEIGTGPKYNMVYDGLTPTVTKKTNQVDGIRQLSLNVSYAPPSFIPIAAIPSPTINYSRDIYLYDSTAKAGS